MLQPLFKFCFPSETARKYYSWKFGKLYLQPMESTHKAAKEVNSVFLNLTCIKQVRLLSYPDSPKNGDYWACREPRSKAVGTRTVLVGNLVLSRIVWITQGRVQIRTCFVNNILQNNILWVSFCDWSFAIHQVVI